MVSRRMRIFILKKLRKSRQISQLKFGINFNIAQNTISRYENEEREADYKTLILFADYFDVSIDYLLGRTENPNRNGSAAVAFSLKGNRSGQEKSYPCRNIDAWIAFLIML